MRGPARDFWTGLGRTLGTGGHWLLRTQTGAPGACLKCIVHYWAVMLNKSQFVQIGTDLSLRISMNDDDENNVGDVGGVGGEVITPIVGNRQM